MKEHFPATIKFLSQLKPVKKVRPLPTKPFNSLGHEFEQAQRAFNLEPGSVNLIDAESFILQHTYFIPEKTNNESSKSRSESIN